MRGRKLLARPGRPTGRSRTRSAMDLNTVTQIVTVALAVLAIIWHQRRTIDKLRDDFDQADDKLRGDFGLDAALETGGDVVGILAESLSRKLKRPDVRRAVYGGGTVMCTPYSPDAPFSAGNAMGRNKLIYAQAGLTVVVASDDGTGGTWSGATVALKHGYGTVAAWRGEGEGPGNEPLQQRGALAGSSLEDVEALLDGSHSRYPSQPQHRRTRLNSGPCSPQRRPHSRVHRRCLGATPGSRTRCRGRGCGSRRRRW